MADKKLIPFDKLQAALDLFDRVEVTYWDGDPRAHQIDNGHGVAVLRVDDVSPMHSADGDNILHIGTNSQWFSNEIVRLMPESYLEKLKKEAVAIELEKWSKFFEDPSMNAMTPSERLARRAQQIREEAK